MLFRSMILYVPANLLPVMTTSTLFGTDDSTILSGVIYFWQDRHRPTGSVASSCKSSISTSSTTVRSMARKASCTGVVVSRSDGLSVFRLPDGIQRNNCAMAWLAAARPMLAVTVTSEPFVSR